MQSARLDGLFGTLFRTMQRRSRALATIVTGDDGTIDAGDGLVWAMVQLRDGQTLTRVRCSKAKPFPGATYTVAPNPTDGVWEVLNPDPVTVRAFFNGLPDPESALNTPAHAWTHRGVVNLDPLLVEPQQILGLQVRPADSGVAVVVSAYPPLGFGETTLNLVSVLPTGGLQQLIIVCYDTTAGSLATVSGATAAIPGWPYVSGSPGAVPFTQADIDAAPVERHHRRLAAVRLYQGQTAVLWSDVFADLRDFVDGRPGWVRLDDDDPTLGGLAEKLTAGSGVTLSRQAGDVLVLSAAAAGGYWDVDAAPESPSALDDEFDDASLDGKWTEYDHGTIQTPSEASDVLTLSQASQASAILSGMTQALPAGDFTIAIRLKLDQDTVSGESAALEAGILLCEDASDSAGDALLVGLTVGESIGARFGWSKWTAYDVRQSAYYQSVPASTWTAGTYVYLRLRRSGTTLYFDHSDDGQNWINKDLTSYLAFTPGDVGVGLYDYATGATLVMDVDFFRYRAVCDPLEEPVHGATTASAGDHGALTGLSDDDHLHYHTDTRGDARYFQKTEFLDESAGSGDAGKPVVLNVDGEIDSSMLPPGSSGDHGDLTGLADDDHAQYHNDTRGDARYFQKTEFLDESAGSGDAGKPVVLNVDGEIDSTMLPPGGSGDHGDLTGLADDDHTQYHTDTRGDARYFQQTEFLDESAGAGDAGSPIKLNADGLVDGSMLPAGSTGYAASVTTKTLQTRTVIDDQTIATDGDDFTTVTIPAGYDYLEIYAYLESENDDGHLYVYLNGDTTAANYKAQRHTWGGTHASAWENKFIDLIVQKASQTGGPISSFVRISNIATSSTTDAEVWTDARNGTSWGDATHARVHWFTSNTVTSLTFSGLTAGLTAGSRLLVVGLKNEDVVTDVDVSYIPVSTAATSTPPTEAQLDTAFGVTSANRPTAAVLNVSGNNTNVYLLHGSSGGWWHTAMTKAT